MIKFSKINTPIFISCMILVFFIFITSLVSAHAYAENIKNKTEGWCFTPDGVIYLQDGKKLYGKHWMNGKIYDFGNYGYLLRDQWVGDYHISEYGYYDNGFTTIDGEDYYFKRFRKQTGIVSLDDTLYGFNSDGIGMTGFFDYEGAVYCADTNHVIQTGWQLILRPQETDIQVEPEQRQLLCEVEDDKPSYSLAEQFFKTSPVCGSEEDRFQTKTCCYYFDEETGQMMQGRIKKIQDEKYAFADDGTLLRNTEAYGCRIKADGAIAHNEWYDGRYYDSYGHVFAEDIQNRTDGWCFSPEGVTYLQNGKKQYGNCKIDGHIYNFGNDGYLLFDQWVNNDYHVSKLGYYDNGFVTIDGADYYLKRYKKQTGIVKVNEEDYAYNDFGVGVCGYFKDGDDIYYATNDHSVLKGWRFMKTIPEFLVEKPYDSKELMYSSKEHILSVSPMDNIIKTGFELYHFDEDTGELSKGGVKPVGNKEYAFNYDGQLMRNQIAYGYHTLESGEVVANAWLGYNYYDSNGEKVPFSGSEGNEGRLYFPEQGNWSVALYWAPHLAEVSQSVVDRSDSAAYICEGSLDKVIADHNNQGFSVLWDTWIGEKIVIVQDGVKYIYEVVDKDSHGTNTTFGVSTKNGNIFASYRGLVAMYTCNSNWMDVTVVWMKFIA